MRFKNGLRQRVAREVHAFYKWAYVSESGICKICTVRLTPTRRAFAKVALQGLRQRVARLQKLRGNADRNFGGRIAADG